ncbi:hypothetical protein O7623_14670 [Solwaraspora sp. WMMD791]|uniref:hypothetical protein n=1 Tax=Solwaraspora sp. WMMD791 TaxID=3016086 RepID=UPI00249A8A3E|nr:hypothetical protein [Solwaraspora sp. WMMD791]WFE30348.1 hypothetical protein O7623_14670 [Solwaraspora sp. WMMD791]
MSRLRAYVEHVKTNDGHVRLWTVVGALAAVIALPLSVVVALASGDDGTSTAGRPIPAGSVEGADPVDDPSRATPVDAASDAPDATVVPAVEVRIPSGTGVDLDAGQHEGVRVDGPIGDIDLHYDVAMGLRGNGADIYPDEGPSAQAAERCARAVAAELDGQPAVAIYRAGQQYCFRTSQGTVGWTRVKDRPGISVDQYVVLDVRLWPDA